MQFSWKSLLVASLAIRQIASVGIDGDATDCGLQEGEESCMLQYQLKTKQPVYQGSSATSPRTPPAAKVKTLTLGKNFKFNDNIKWSDASAPDRAQQHAKTSSECLSGGRLWVAQSGVDMVMESVFPELLAAAETLAIPPISGSADLMDTDFLKWTYSVSNFAVSNISFGDAPPDIHFVPDVGLGISVSGLVMTLAVDYDIQPVSDMNPFGFRGSIKVTTSPVTSITGRLQMSTSATGKPEFGLAVTNFNLQLDEISVQTDSMFEGILDFGANLMRHILVAYVNPQVPPLIEGFVNSTINNEISDVELRMLLDFLPVPYNDFAVDFGLCSIDFTEKYLVADLHALIVSTTQNIEYNETPPMLPDAPDRDVQMIELELMSWGINAGMNMAYEMDLLTFTIYQLGDSIQNQARKMMAAVSPGRQVPGDAAFKINILADSAPLIYFDQDGISLNGTFKVSTMVTDGQGVEWPVLALAVPGHFRVNVHVSDDEPQQASLTLDHFEAEDASLLITEHVNISMGELMAYVNSIGSELILPQANTFLQDYKLDLGPWGGVHLKNATLESKTGHLAATSDISINVEEMFNIGLRSMLMNHHKSRRGAVRQHALTIEH